MKRDIAECGFSSYRLESISYRSFEYFHPTGFRAEKWQTMAQALQELAQSNDIAKAEAMPFGQRYVIDGTIRSPDGRNPMIRTVWFVEKETDNPYFVTAYPLRKR